MQGSFGRQTQSWIRQLVNHRGFRLPSQPPTAGRKTEIQLDELEPRLCFSTVPIIGDLLLEAIGPSFGEQFSPANTADAIQVDQAERAAPAVDSQVTPVELIFIDGQVDDQDTLIANLRAQFGNSTRIHLLDASTDGIDQISQVLAEQQSVASVHVVSHGTNGNVQLGSSELSSATLESYASRIAGWSLALNTDADILFYGCNLAESGEGQELIESLSALTGADIAASEDLTGHVSLGGDWDLEFTVGNIETAIAFSPLGLQEWQSSLAAYTVTSVADDGSAGTLRWAIDQANASAGQDTIDFNISGNGVHTIQLTGTRLEISDSTFLDATTQTGFAVGAPVIEVDGSSVSGGEQDIFWLTGGSSTIQGFMLNNAGDEAIDIESDGNRIVGNFIGTDTTGSLAVGNGVGIIVESDNNIIGGTSAAERNVISGNLGAGIDIAGSSQTGNQILGNYIGTDATGSVSIGNGWHGIVLQNGAHANVIGGTDLGEANIIAHNGGDGVALQGPGNGYGNSIRGNQIFDNDERGIDIWDDGVTSNDYNASGIADADDGPNRVQNFPDLISATIDGDSVTIVGDVSGRDFVDYTLDFYVNTTADSTGFGEAERYLGSTLVTTDGGGLASFNVTLFSVSLRAGESLTATATHSDGSTSEFSRNVITTATSALPYGALWFSTQSDITASGIAGLPNWLDDEIVQIADPNLVYGDTTSGRFSTSFSLFEASGGSVDTNIDGMHVVRKTHLVNGAVLNPGDLLLSIDSDEALGGIAVTQNDLFVFRPDAPGDYTAGTFEMVVDELTSYTNGLSDFALVEADINVGGRALQRGELLINESFVNQDFILHYDPITDTVDYGTPLVDGADIGLGGKYIRGIELIERTTTVGGYTIDAGHLLVSFGQSGSTDVGISTLTAQRNDVLDLEVQTAGWNTVANAALFVDGSDLGLNGNENPTALSLFLPAHRKNLFVDTNLDVLDGDTSSVAALLSDKGADGFISLREAIIATNNSPNGVWFDQILLGEGTYVLNQGSGDNNAVSGDLDIKDNVILVGAGARTTIIDGNGLDRVFHLHGNSTARMSGITIQGGLASNNGGGIFVDNSSRLDLSDSVIANNDGGNGNGGGVHVHGTLNLDRVLIAGNVANKGAGVYFHNAVAGNLRNVTISGNTAASEGGGLWTENVVSVFSSTIAHNEAPNGGGIFDKSGGDVVLTNSILFNPTSNNSNRALDSGGFNIDSDGSAGLSGRGDLNSVDPLLGALQDNGGRTDTHALLAGSVAIHSGSTVNAPDVDQTGAARDLMPDIGAFESTFQTTKVYWAERDSGSIFRANSDGTAVQQILTGLDNPLGLELDSVGGKLYWIESTDNSLHRADLDGSNTEVLDATNLVNAQGLGLDLANRHIYVADSGGGTDDAIRRFNLDGGGFITIANSLGGTIRDIAVDSVDNKIYFTHDTGGLFAGKIKRVDFSGGAVENVKTGLVGPNSLVIDQPAGRIYYADNGSAGVDRIGSVDLADGGNYQQLSTAGLNDPLGIDIDIATGKIFWSDASSNFIQSSDLDGGNSQDVITGLNAPQELAVITLGVAFNTAPTIDATSFSLDENTTSAGGIPVTDPDATDTITWVITGGGADDGLFAIDGTSGELTFLATPNFELPLDLGGNNTYEVEVEVGDGTDSVTEIVFVNVNDVNERPTAITVPTSSIDENTDTNLFVGFFLGALTTTDEDSPETFAYAIVGGADASNFVLSSDELFFDDGVLDFETKSSYSVDIEVTDSAGNTHTESISIGVNDLNDAPIVNDQIFAIGESSSNGTTIGAIAANDVDSGVNGTLTFALVGGTGAAAFDVDSSGTITLVNNSLLDAVAAPTLTLDIVVADGGGLSGSATISIDVSQNVIANADAYSTDEDTVLIVSASNGVLANDQIALADPTPGAVLEYDARRPGTSGRWEDTTGLAGYDWDFSGTSATQDTNPANAPPGITATAVLDGSGGGTIAERLGDLPGDPTDGSASFEFWIRPTDAVGTEILLDIGDGFRGVSLRLNGSQLEWLVNTQLVLPTVVAIATQDISAEIASGDFIHVVATIDLDAPVPTANIYVNAAAASSGSNPSLGDWSNSNDSLGLGHSVGSITTLNPTGADPFEGEIAIFRFYDFALDTTQVQRNFDAVHLNVTVADTTSTLGAAVTVAADGSFTYDAGTIFDYQAPGDVPAIDTFTYTTSDVAGNLSQTTVTVSITPVNDAPLLGNHTFLISEGLPTSLNAGMLGATDADNDSLTLVFSASNVTGGQFELASSPSVATTSFTQAQVLAGEVTFVDDGDEFAPTFSIAVGDGDLDVGPVDATVLFTSVNDAPTISSDGGSSTATLSIVENTALVTTVVASDVDLSGDTLTYSLAGGADVGHFMIDPSTGVLTFVSPPDFENPGDSNGNNDYEVVVAAGDGNGGTDTQMITVSVTDQNESPTAIVLGSANIDENVDTTSGVFLGFLSATDEDTPESFTYSIVGGTDATSLFLSVDTKSVFIQDGVLDFETQSSYDVTIRVTDSSGNTFDESVTVNVNDLNETPIAMNDAYLVDEGGTINVNALLGFLSNDTDPDGDVLSLSTVITGTTHGTGTFNADGSFTYTHDGSENFVDGLVYEVTDGRGGLATGTLTINITPVNDNTPAVTDKMLSIAAGDKATEADLEMGGNLLSGLTDSDLPNDMHRVDTIAVTVPSFGSLTLNGDGSFVYIHDGSFNTLDSFTYSVIDKAGNSTTATVDISIAVPNVAPVADLDIAAKSVVEGGTLALDASDSSDVDGTIVSYEWDFNYNGSFDLSATGITASFSAVGLSGPDTRTIALRVTDDSGNSSIIATADITIVNAPPIAGDDMYAVDEDGFLSIESIAGLLSNDTDVPSDSLVVDTIPAAEPAHGTLTLNSDGSFVYVPDANFHGIDSFQYHVTDQDGGTAVATAVIDVQAINDAPVAKDDSFTTDRNVAVSGSVAFNDGDVDSSTLKYSLLSSPTAGTISFNIDGTFTYTPGNDFSGSDSFLYDVQDELGATATATVQLTVQPTNRPPNANDDSFLTNEDTAIAGTVAANDTDADGDPLTFTLVRPPSIGTLIFNEDGTFNYAPATGQHQTVSFVYQVTDASGKFDTATVSIIVQENDPPQANNDAFTTLGDDLLVISQAELLANDMDPEGDDVTLMIVRSPQNGRVNVTSDGSIEFAAAAGFVGTDTFAYTITDGHSVSEEATVTITILGAPPINTEVSNENEVATDPIEGDDIPDDGTEPSDNTQPQLTGDAFVQSSSRPEGDAPSSEPATVDTATFTDGSTTGQDSELASSPDQFGPSQNGAIVATLATEPETSDDSATGTFDSSPVETAQPALLTPSTFVQFIMPGATYEAIVEGMDDLRSSINNEIDVPQLAVEGFVAATSSFSVGAALWLLRGGYVFASVISALPAWQTFDPIPILAYATKEEDDDETVESLLG